VPSEMVAILSVCSIKATGVMILRKVVLEIIQSSRQASKNLEKKKSKLEKGSKKL
jgi:hypothetical protein